MPNDSILESENFDRVLSLPQVTASGVAIIIGAGIYVLLGPAAQMAGAHVWLSFLIASLLSALTAFSYMELSSMFPKAGSEQEFARHAFPTWISTAVGWTVAFALVVATATVAVGFARYFNEFHDTNTRATAFAITVAMAIISFFGMQRAIWLILTLGAVEVGGLVLIVIIGAPSIGEVALFESPDLSGVVSAASLVFFAFIGFDEVITLSEETRNPRRTTPIALMLALAISACLYIAVAIVTVSVLGVNETAISARPLTQVASQLLGERSAKLVAAVALISTSSTVLLALNSAARMVYGTTSISNFPRVLSTIYRRRTPLPALVACTLTALGLILFEDISFLAGATDVLIYFLFVVVNLALIVLRKKLPNYPRPFRVRGSIGNIPILPILGLFATIMMGMRIEAKAFWLSVLIIACSVLVALIGERRPVRHRERWQG